MHNALGMGPNFFTLHSLLRMCIVPGYEPKRVANIVEAHPTHISYELQARCQHLYLVSNDLFDDESALQRELLLLTFSR